MVGPGVDRLDQHPEKPKQYGHLDDKWTQAAHGVDPRLAVEPHGLLRDPLPVPAEAVLDLPHSRLQVGHRLHLAQLLDGEGQRHQPYDDGKDNDCNSHVVETDGVEHHQQVQHGTDYYFSPEIVDTQ